MSSPKKIVRKKTFQLSSVLLPITGLCVGLFAAYVYVKANPPTIPIIKNPLVQTTPTPTPTPGPKPVSMLLLGYGGPDHDGGYLTDTLIQVVIQPEQKRILMITIPRDLSVSVPISESQLWQDKINSAYAIGIDDKTYPNKPEAYKGSKNPGAIAEKLIGDITGFPVQSYVALSFDGFVKAIDTLGGVDVSFTEGFDDYRYPIKGKENDTCGKSDDEVASLSATLKGDQLEEQFPCRFEHVHVEKGKQHLDGTTALKVARSRHSVQTRGDFSRSERQKIIIQAAKEKVFEVGFLPKAVPFFLSLGKDLKTDVDIGFMTSFLPFAQELRSYKIVGIALSDENVLDQGYNERGQYVLVPKEGAGNWSGIQSFISQEATKSSQIQNATPSGYQPR